VGLAGSSASVGAARKTKAGAKGRVFAFAPTMFYVVWSQTLDVMSRVMLVTRRKTRS
jgi:hypothetical protein